MKYQTKNLKSTILVAFTFGILISICSNLRAETVDIALVIDSSGSMGDTLCDSTKMFWAKEAAKLYVELTDLDDAMAVIPFSTTADVAFPMTNADLIDKPTLKSSVIDPITPDGWSTNIWDALQTAKDEIDAFTATDPKDNNAIILLTDGLHNHWGSNPCDVDLAGSDIRFFLTTFGHEHYFSTDYLQCQLDATDGIWYHADCDNLDDFDFPSVHYWDYYLETHNMVAFKQSKKKIYSNQTTYEKYTIDEYTKKANFIIHWGSGVLSMYLISPSGKAITPRSAEYSNSIRHGSSKTWCFFELLEPETGEWGMVIKRKSWGQCAQNQHYVAQVGGMNSTLNFSVDTDKLIYKNKEKIFIKTKIHTNKFNTKTEVICKVNLFNKYSEQFYLYDDGKHKDGKPGDGVYANYFNPEQFDYQGGPYEISCFAYNTKSKSLNQREPSESFHRMKTRTVYVTPKNPPIFVFGKIIKMRNNYIAVKDQSGVIHSTQLINRKAQEYLFIGCRVQLAIQKTKKNSLGKLLDWERRK